MESGSERENVDLRQHLLDAVAPLRELKTSMDSLFGDFYPGDWSALASVAALPMHVNFYRAGDRAIIECTVPGAKKQDIEITMSGNVVTIIAEFRKPIECPDRFFLHEIPSGRQQRAIQVPFPVRAEQMKARYENGMLRVIIHDVQDHDNPPSRLSID